MTEPSSPLVPTLLAWTDGNLRDLPWRRTRDPWAILVAEAMLQQTQVARVADRWVRFVERYPDAASCAAASPAEILREWAGLGYNRRALMLHRAATAIRDDHGGSVPPDLHALLALPGVGPYTARAVLAFAFEAAVAPIDTNIGRVLARLRGARLGGAEAQRLADALVPEEAAWRWNQGLMELGATVCTKRSPACGTCPVAELCRWRGSGPDPATDSAGASTPQTPFVGSDRELRGRVIDELRDGPGLRAAVVARVSPDDLARGDEIVERLHREGLVELADGRVQLPGEVSSVR